METTSRVGAQAPAAEGGQQVPSARRTVDGYLRAPFPWYGLDEAFTGPRWLMQVGTSADGAVEHGSIGHGDEPSVKNEAGSTAEPKEKFAVVVTVAANPSRRSADGTGLLEATSVSSAAWLAGVGLLSFTWPGQMDHSLRDDWLDQQTETAWVLADDLHQPAPAREGLVQAVPGEGRAQIAVDGPPGGGYGFSVLRGRRLRDCRTRRLHGRTPPRSRRSGRPASLRAYSSVPHNNSAA